MTGCNVEVRCPKWKAILQFVTMATLNETQITICIYILYSGFGAERHLIVGTTEGGAAFTTPVHLLDILFVALFSSQKTRHFDVIVDTKDFIVISSQNV